MALAAGLGSGREALIAGEKPNVLTRGFGSAETLQKAFGNEGKKPLRLGLIIGIGNDPDVAMAKVHELGLPTCQVYVTKFTPGLVGSLGKALGSTGLRRRRLWWEGRAKRCGISMRGR